jgi:hypothetical protein
MSTSARYSQILVGLLTSTLERMRADEPPAEAEARITADLATLLPATSAQLEIPLSDSPTESEVTDALSTVTQQVQEIYSQEMTRLLSGSLEVSLWLLRELALASGEEPGELVRKLALSMAERATGGTDQPE